MMSNPKHRLACALALVSSVPLQALADLSPTLADTPAQALPATLPADLLGRRADLVALARHHLYDPYFTHHAAKEQGFAAPWSEPYHWAMAKYQPRASRRD